MSFIKLCLNISHVTGVGSILPKGGCHNVQYFDKKSSWNKDLPKNVFKQIFRFPQKLDLFFLGLKFYFFFCPLQPNVIPFPRPKQLLIEPIQQSASYNRSVKNLEAPGPSGDFCLVVGHSFENNRDTPNPN